MKRNMKEMGMSNRDIAKELAVSRNKVSRMLKRKKRGSKLDPYREKIRALIDEHNLSGVRILEEIRKSGYNGGYTILKDYCHDIRKDRRIQAVYRYETEPGKQSQVDFGEFGYIDMEGIEENYTLFPLSLDTQGQGMQNLLWAYPQRM